MYHLIVYNTSQGHHHTKKLHLNKSNQEYSVREKKDNVNLDYVSNPQWTQQGGRRVDNGEHISR